MNELYKKAKILIRSILPARVEKTVKRLKRPLQKIGPNGRILLHLGCGYIDDHRFVNIDRKRLPHVHYVKDVENLGFLAEDFADLIYASHVLEHISHLQVRKVLANWKRVLKPGGILRLSVPDFDRIIEIYNNENKDIGKIETSMMGGQEDADNYHQSIYNRDYLERLLVEAGYRQVNTWQPDQAEFSITGDWAGRLLYDKYPISLNIEAKK